MEMDKPTNWVAAILGDVQFWLPVAALIGGLALLHWIA